MFGTPESFEYKGFRSFLVGKCDLQPYALEYCIRMLSSFEVLELEEICIGLNCFNTFNYFYCQGQRKIFSLATGILGVIFFLLCSLLHLTSLMYFLLQLTQCCCSIRKIKNFAPGSFLFTIWIAPHLLVSRYIFMIIYITLRKRKRECYCS